MYSVGSSAALLLQMGRALGQATAALATFDHPSFHRTFAWDLRQFRGVATFAPFIPEATVTALVQRTLADFDATILPASEVTSYCPISSHPVLFCWHAT